jgi:transposase
MKVGTDRKYTPEFCEAAIKQVVEGGRNMPSVARSLEMSPKTLANWVYRARRGRAILKRQLVKPVSDLEAEVTRLRQENARLRVEKDILKKAAAYFAKESM